MAILFEDLGHVYGLNTPFEFRALENINLELIEGQITAIVGETGSGKSTLVQHLNALLLPTEGKVTIQDKVIIAGEKPKQLKALREKVGLVFQFSESQLFEESVIKDVMFGPLNFGKSEEEAKALAIEALDLVGLEREYFEQSPLELSGGQKRRVAIAGILAVKPSILVLDEPTAGLDPQGAKQMMTLFDQINQQSKTTILLVTHDMQHVLDYADRVVVVSRGQILFHDEKVAFFENEKLLNELEIVVPKVISMREALIAKGFDLSRKIYNIEELASAVAKEIAHG